MPLSKLTGELRKVIKAFHPDYVKKEENISYYIGEFTKYCALNIGALNKYGTLEFRHFPGAYDKTELLGWVNSIMALKRFVIKTTPPLQEIFDMLNEDWEKATSMLFKGTPIINLVNKELIEEGLLNAGVLLTMFYEIKAKKKRKLKASLFAELYPNTPNSDTIIFDDAVEVPLRENESFVPPSFTAADIVNETTSNGLAAPRVRPTTFQNHLLRELQGRR